METNLDKESPLSQEEEKRLARANVYLMDVEMDGGTLPPAIDALSWGNAPLSPSEARVILRWFDRTAPGNF